MKKYLFLLVCSLFAHFAFSQEEISREVAYVSLGDTAFVVQTTVVTNNGLEGINDTLVSYSEVLDSAGVANQVYTDYVNRLNTGAARWRNNYAFRTIINEYIKAEETLESFDVDLDSVSVARWSRLLIGRWKVFPEGGYEYFVNIEEHPARADLLRATSEDDGSRMNILVLSRHVIRVAFDDGIRYLLWDGASTERPMFRHPSMAFPPVFVTNDQTKMVKVN